MGSLCLHRSTGWLVINTHVHHFTYYWLAISTHVHHLKKVKISVSPETICCKQNQLLFCELNHCVQSSISPHTVVFHGVTKADQQADTLTGSSLHNCYVGLYTSSWKEEIIRGNCLYGTNPPTRMYGNPLNKKSMSKLDKTRNTRAVKYILL